MEQPDIGTTVQSNVQTVVLKCVFMNGVSILFYSHVHLRHRWPFLCPRNPRHR